MLGHQQHVLFAGLLTKNNSSSVQQLQRHHQILPITSPLTILVLCLMPPQHGACELPGVGQEDFQGSCKLRPEDHAW